MMVGVVSDTHDNVEMVERAVEVLNSYELELVIHAGDIVAPFTLKRFSGLRAKMVCVFGNNDGEKTLLAKAASSLGIGISEQPLELEIGGRKILVFHGFGGARTTEIAARALASTGEYDVVVYGHTHEASIERLGSALVLNPGEVFGGLSGRSTLAVVDLEKMEATLIEL